jgi:hypothetical protein
LLIQDHPPGNPIDPSPRARIAPPTATTHPDFRQRIGGRVFRWRNVSKNAKRQAKNAVLKPADQIIHRRIVTVLTASQKIVVILKLHIKLRSHTFRRWPSAMVTSKWRN